MTDYNFDVRVAKGDREGYYYTDWSKATPMTLVADTKQNAINKAIAIMGLPPRGRYWIVKVDKVYPV